MPSEGFNQMQICVCVVLQNLKALQPEMSVQDQNTYYPVKHIMPLCLCYGMQTAVKCHKNTELLQTNYLQVINNVIICSHYFLSYDNYSNENIHFNCGNKCPCWNTEVQEYSSWQIHKIMPGTFR